MIKIHPLSCFFVKYRLKYMYSIDFHIYRREFFIKKYANAFLKKLTAYLEFIIAIILAAGIIMMTIQLILSFGNLPDLNKYPNYDDLLTTCFNLIIGVEMIRMLYLHTPMTVFEVLLFATRKFLFVAFDESEKIIFRSNMKVRYINKLIHINIPYHDNETLLDVILRKLNEDETEIGVGACTYFQDFGLRIAKITDGRITRIEVIRSIQ